MFPRWGFRVYTHRLTDFSSNVLPRSPEYTARLEPPCTQTPLRKPIRRTCHGVMVYFEIVVTGATAFESIGPHVPAGMLRRLNIVAQRQRGNHSHVESEPAASALRRHPADSSAGTRRGLSGRANEQSVKECRARRRHERNQGHATHTHDEIGESIGERLLVPLRDQDRGAGEGGNRTAAGRGGSGPTDSESVIFSRDDVDDDEEEAQIGGRTVGPSRGNGGEESPDHHRAR